MPSFFGSKEKSSTSRPSAERLPRHSSGWGQLLQRLQSSESLRVLDIGPTSPNNINFITSLGHSIYLANLVEDAAKPEWLIPEPDGSSRFDVDRFLSTHLNFSGRGFDVVLFWDTADFLPEQLLHPVVQRIHEVMAPGGQMLAMFHAKPAVAPSTPVKADFNRYHLSDGSRVDIQRAGDYPLLNTYTNRKVEKLFEAFKSFHFFLGKDNVREVIVTR